jgi:hypothetical protein
MTLPPSLRQDSPSTAPADIKFHPSLLLAHGSPSAGIQILRRPALTNSAPRLTSRRSALVWPL